MAIKTLGNTPFPITEPITDKSGRLIGAAYDWFVRLPLTLSRSVERAHAVNLTGQSAAIAATDCSGGGLNAGLYRVSYYARITQAATTSSSLTVTLAWTDDTLTPSYSGAAITGNTTTTVQSGSILIDVDGAKAINYSTAYASVGATSMQYKLSVVVEKVDA